ncbi:hypothetical protein V8E54_011893 [Elaphomyces granulatus]
MPKFSPTNPFENTPKTYYIGEWIDPPDSLEPIPIDGLGSGDSRIGEWINSVGPPNSLEPIPIDELDSDDSRSDGPDPDDYWRLELVLNGAAGVQSLDPQPYIGEWINSVGPPDSLEPIPIDELDSDDSRSDGPDTDHYRRLELVLNGDGTAGIQPLDPRRERPDSYFEVAICNRTDSPQTILGSDIHFSSTNNGMAVTLRLGEDCVTYSHDRGAEGSNNSDSSSYQDLNDGYDSESASAEGNNISDSSSDHWQDLVIIDGYSESASAKGSDISDSSRQDLGDGYDEPARPRQFIVKLAVKLGVVVLTLIDQLTRVIDEAPFFVQSDHGRNAKKDGLLYSTD